jgi:Protein of unknown function (DUF1549)/Protein of unknown function (DUF1553)
VIQAFNQDLPYYQFVKAQLAADLLDEPQRSKMLLALGMLALGPWYFDLTEPAIARADERNERIDVVSRGFLGVTVACARCHNHKYDPFFTQDYYALGGIFASTNYAEYPLAPEAPVKAYQEQLSTEYSEENFAKDGDNRLLWRANRRRMDAETLRDSLLFAGGDLDLSVGGPSVDLTDDCHRRTVYSKVSRSKEEGRHASSAAAASSS